MGLARRVRALYVRHNKAVARAAHHGTTHPPPKRGWGCKRFTRRFCFRALGEPKSGFSLFARTRPLTAWHWWWYG